LRPGRPDARKQVVQSGELIEKGVLRAAGLAGLAIFGFFFALTFRVPQWIEKFAEDFIQREVAAQVDARIDAVGLPHGNGTAVRLAAELYQRNAAQIEELKATLKDRSRDVFLAALEQVRDQSCECRRRIEEFRREMSAARLLNLAADNERVQAFIHGGYMHVVADLRREARIFTAVNALSFAVLLALSFGKPRATRHLLFPGVLLLCATLFSAYLYLFSQDWLLTIIHGSYVGYAYAGYLGIAYLFLCDIALNRGRVTTSIANGMGSALGSAASWTPC
jgi:hypothetical protein